MEARIRLVLAEDNLLVREGLTRLLVDGAEVELVRSVTSLAELDEAIDAEEPNLVLTDVRMPPTHSDEGIRCARALRVSRPSVGVVVLSAYADPIYAMALFDGGTRGRGYVLKDRVDDREYLLSAIRSVAAGGSFIDDQVVEGLVRSRIRGAGPSIQSLTPREREVLAELATGHSNGAIAQALGVSNHAVEKHTGSIFAKLGLTEERDVNRRVKAVLHYLEDVARSEHQPSELMNR